MEARLTLTAHAGRRLQQRGIRPQAVEVLLDYGCVEFDHHGACIYYLDKTSRRHLDSDCGQEGVPRPDLPQGIYAVVSEDGAVVTVGHLRRRIFQDRKRGSYPWKHAS